MVLVLFETAAGFALFRLHDDAKLQKVDQLARDFENPTQAQKMYALLSRNKFLVYRSKILLDSRILLKH